jgi:hypothetical protein
LRFSEKTMPTHIDLRSIDGQRIPIERDGLNLRLPRGLQGHYMLLFEHEGQWHQQPILTR